MAENTTFQAAAYTAQGAERDSVTLPATLFDGTVNMPVWQQAVKRFLANQRQGNASTKIRKYVTGGNQKPWKQKGTGRARQGSIRAPQWVGGGTVFGPVPRSYAQYVPRQVRQLARKSAFNARARENAIYVIDTFSFDAPKTKLLLDLITRLGVADQKVLILTDGVKQNVFLSGRNLPAVHVMPYSDVSTYHILWSELVLIEESALSGAPEDSAAGATPETSPAAETKKVSRARVTKAKAETKSAPKAAKKAVKAEKKPAAKRGQGAKREGKAAKKKGK